MKTTSYKTERAQKTVKSFCDHVFWLRRIRNIFAELFEREDAHQLMKKTAVSFFDDLNTILHRYLLLEFAKITDPPESGKKNHKIENLTVDNLVLSIDWPPEIRDKLCALSKKALTFRDYILEPRNKILAHLDKDTFLTENTLGVFPEGEDEAFLKTLEEICNITHEACFGSIIGDLILTQSGDVIDFKKTLHRSIAFDQLLAESNGEEIFRISSYLERAKYP